jgi:uncharacterized protein
MLAAADHTDLDAGPRKAPGTERLCAVTGDVKPIDDMIRFVVGPDGAVVPDLKRKLPGRGIWITASRDTLKTAVARKAFAKSFRREVIAGADLITATERLLERAVLDTLAMAHKGGRVLTGFTKVENALTREPVGALIHASDAAADGVRKLDSALRHRDDAEKITVISAFTGDQLNLALGRPNVVHAALLASPDSEAFLARLRRLDRFRTGDKTGRAGQKPAN